MTGLVCSTCCFLLAATTAHASSIGLSWDGHPPGNVLQWKGLSDVVQGHDAFAPGDYVLTFEPGVTAWRNGTTIWRNGGIVVPSGAFGFISITFTATSAWQLSADTPSVTDARSTGPQWVWWDIGPNTLGCALEDIDIIAGDRDYNDLFCTVERRPTFIPPLETPPTAVPEPRYVLVLAGFVLLILLHQLGWTGHTR